MSEETFWMIAGLVSMASLRAAYDAASDATTRGRLSLMMREIWESE